VIKRKLNSSSTEQRNSSLVSLTSPLVGSHPFRNSMKTSATCWETLFSPQVSLLTLAASLLNIASAFFVIGKSSSSPKTWLTPTTGPCRRFLETPSKSVPGTFRVCLPMPSQLTTVSSLHTPIADGRLLSIHKLRATAGSRTRKKTTV